MAKIGIDSVRGGTVAWSGLGRRYDVHIHIEEGLWGSFGFSLSRISHYCKSLEARNIQTVLIAVRLAH